MKGHLLIILNLTPVQNPKTYESMMPILKQNKINNNKENKEDYQDKRNLI